MTVHPSHIKLARLLAPSIALATSGGILALSYYTSPILRAIIIQPSQTSEDGGRSAKSMSTAFALSELRRLFSSGSHVFPQLATLSSALSFYLAYSLPAHRAGYILAGVLAIAIAPVTTGIMVPACNGRLIELDERVNKKKEDDFELDPKEVVALLKTFEQLNAVRAFLLGMGGFVDVWMALS